jgi:hypothetical protein
LCAIRLTRTGGLTVRATALAILLCTAAVAPARAAGPTAELSPDSRPVLVLEPAPGPLLLVRHAQRLADRRPESALLKLGHWIAAPMAAKDRTDHRTALPAPWLTTEPDRGFSQALLMQLSHAPSNWPWRTLIVSSSAAETETQLQALAGQDVVAAQIRTELADLGGKVEYHLTLELTTARAAAPAHEGRAHTHVEYFATPLPADPAAPRRRQGLFAMEGSLDSQVSTAATDLGQFLAMIVGRVSVPAGLRPHNPTLGELSLHPVCDPCRPSDPVIYLQPGRVWVRVGRSTGTILALPLQSNRPPTARTRELGSQGIP